MDKEFNLLHSPWILAIKPDGQIQELSLLDVFKRAHEFKDFAGELPTQNVAVLRLLLAVLYVVFGRWDANGDELVFDDDESWIKGLLNLWKSLWDSKQFPFHVIEKYLLEHEDRFWLFHSKFPFYQVAELAKGTDYDSAKLNGELSESGNKIRLFPIMAGNAKLCLSYSEAARWLLHVNGFDDTSAKPKAKGLPSPGAGWLGKLGLVTAKGDNLFEMLLLNLVLLKDAGKDLWGKERPIWEMPVKSDERTEIVCPDNQSELLTLQSRRLLLKRNGNKVVGYSLLGGDFFQKENTFNEQMTIWKNTAKKEKDPDVYIPNRHNPAKQLWRNFSSLVVQGTDRKRRPGIVSWLAYLKNKQKLSQRHYNFQIASVKYGDKDFFVDDIFSDSLSFSVQLLADLESDWITRILSEIDTADKLVYRLGLLAQNIAQSIGNTDGNAYKEQAKEQAYFRLDEPFRKWLENINPEADDKDIKCEEWWSEAQSIVRRLGGELIKQVGVRSLVGRNVKDREGKEYACSAPVAYNNFLYSTKNRDTLMKRGKQK